MRARGRRIPDGFLRAAALALSALLCGSAAAADFRVGVGADVVHRQGMAVAALRYGPATGFLWHDNYAFALTYELRPREGWEAGLGAFLARHTGPKLGTNLNAMVRIGYCHKRVCLSGMHISHGSTFGIARDRTNAGLNFLMLEFR